MGSVVISVEVGSGWGHHPDGDGASDERYRETLSAWRRASYIFDRHEVPATWLVAGHLVAPVSGPDPPDVRDRPAVSDRQGASQGSGDEPDAPPCAHPHQEESSQFPGDSTADRSARSVPDLIEGLRRSRVAHEIGCLPFSRADFGDASQTDAAAEVRASIDAAAELGVGTEQLRAFAFPDGRVGNRDVLVAYGFECYREPGSREGGPLSSLRTLVWLFGRRFAGAGPPLAQPRTDEHGLVAMPTSSPLFPLAGRPRAAMRAGRGDRVAELVKRGIERAGETDRVFHLSFSPSDLDAGADFDRLEAVLSYVAERRAETDLTVETLGQVARRLGDRATTTPTPVR